MQLNMGGLRLNTLFLYYFFHHLFLYFFFFFFNFPSFCSLYFLFFYFLLQPMLILIALSWCHKFQLHFISVFPQIKGTFIKIERFKMKPCPSPKEDDKSSWEQYDIILLSLIVLYWIWSSLDSDESLLVTGISPRIFGL